MSTIGRIVVWSTFPAIALSSAACSSASSSFETDPEDLLARSKPSFSGKEPNSQLLAGLPAGIRLGDETVETRAAEANGPTRLAFLYSKNLRSARWIAWHLQSSDYDETVPRSDSFRPDLLVEGSSVGHYVLCAVGRI